MIVTVERKIRNNYIMFNAIHIQSLNANSILKIVLLMNINYMKNV